MKLSIEFLKRRARPLGLVVCDALIILLCVYAALLTRFAPNIRAEDIHAVTTALPCLIIAYVAVFALFGMYRIVWRYSETMQLVRQAMAVIVGFGVNFGLNELTAIKTGELLLSRYYLIILWIFVLAGICCFREALRLLKSYYRQAEKPKDDTGSRVLWVGAESLTPQIEASILVDDDDSKQGQLFCGIPVAGKTSDIPVLVSDEDITHIIISCPSANDEIVKICISTGCFVKIIR